MEPAAAYSGEKAATGIDGSGESFRRCDKVWS